MIAKFAENTLWALCFLVSVAIFFGTIAGLCVLLNHIAMSLEEKVGGFVSGIVIILIISVFLGGIITFVESIRGLI